MVVKYNVFGRPVGSHVLAMITLGSAGLVGMLSGGGKKTETAPPIQAQSTDEEKFIKDFIAKAEAETKAAVKH